MKIATPTSARAGYLALCSAQAIPWLLLLFWSITELGAQPATLSLQQCYELAQNSYPTAANLELLDAAHDLKIRNLNKSYLPQVQLNAQATWQSDVTGLPIDLSGFGFDVPQISKDQYKATLELRQTLWDGGLTGRQKDLELAALQVDKQSTQVDLYNLRNRINQLYFGILLADEQLGLNKLFQENLQSRIQKMEALVANGTATRADLSRLRAEQLKTEQQELEIQSSRRSAVGTMGLLLHQDLDENTRFVLPDEYNLPVSAELRRPELSLFQSREHLLAVQRDLIPAMNTPKISAFATGGYGRPGLNFLDNDFAAYAIVGVGFSWNLSALYNGKQSNDRQLLMIQQQQVDLQKQAFVLNTKTQLQELQQLVTQLRTSIEKDDEQISLRESIRQSAEAQLDNGVITPSDYLTELTNENQARLNRAIHGLQLLLAQANYQVASGQ